MATNVLYQIILRQAVGHIQTAQAFYYFNPSAGDGENALAMAEQFEAVVLPAINAAQGDHVANIEIQSRSGYYPYSSVVVPLTGGGLRTDEGSSILPPFMAVAAYLVPDSVQQGLPEPIIKRGYKRFSGLFEEDIQGGMLALGWISEYADALETALLANLTANGTFYAPSIHVNKKGEGLTWRNSFITAVSGWKITTQNSRKR